MIQHSPLRVSKKLLDAALSMSKSLGISQAISPAQMISELKQVVEFETKDTLSKKIEEQLGFRENSCKFEKQVVSRSKSDLPYTVDCLTVKDPGALSGLEQGLEILSAWMRAESLDYYRISCPVNTRILFYDKATRSGIYWKRDQDQEVEIHEVLFTPKPWDPVFAEMAAWATRNTGHT